MWMETRNSACIHRECPKLQNPEAYRLVKLAHWPLTSPPLHNNKEVLAGFVKELTTLQRRRKNPLSAGDRESVKETIARLEDRKRTDRYFRESCLLKPSQKMFAGFGKQGNDLLGISIHFHYVEQ